MMRSYLKKEKNKARVARSANSMHPSFLYCSWNVQIDIILYYSDYNLLEDYN